MHRVKIGWAHPETEHEYRVTLDVTEATPDRGPDFGCAGGYPGDPATVEVVEVWDDVPGGALHPELVEVVERDLGLLLDAALEAVEEGWDDAQAEREERT